MVKRWQANNNISTDALTLLLLKVTMGAGEMALQAKVSATKPDDLFGGQEPTWWKGKTDPRDLSSHLRMGMV